MNIVLKKTCIGFVAGLIFSAAVYVVLFAIELVSFIKEYIEHDSAYSLSRYTALLPVWNWVTALMIVGCVCLITVVVGFIAGVVKKSDMSQKFSDDKMSMIDDGAKRQKIHFASNIRSMADTLTASCDENLYYMTNFVETEYISGTKNTEIMKELVKFVEYEQTIKDSIENIEKEGGC